MRTTFCVRYRNEEGDEQPFNHCKPWSQELLAELERKFRLGASLAELCVHFQRRSNGIIAKLEQLNLIGGDWKDNEYRIIAKPWQPNSIQPQPTQEPTMADKAAPTIETKTLIAGQDASTMTDAQIFKKIAELEASVESLGRIKAKPNKLVKTIDGIQADIAKLVEYVDSREETP